MEAFMFAVFVELMLILTAFDCVCVGYGNGVSAPGSLDDDVLMYQVLKERFEGCTYVDGNLEIKFLRQKHYDLTFLKDIREVTGYVIILLLYQDVVLFPSLRVIRGNELYDGNALYVAINHHDVDNGTGLRELQFPQLHEIVKGNVKFQNNRDLCYVQTIDWDDMREGLVPTFMDHGDSCTAKHVCSPECPGGCWGPGADMCQVLTRKNCSGTCDYRCNGPTQAGCCHRSCAAGCTGPSNKECWACLKFTMDDQCVESCPTRTIYNPTTFQNELNPDFRYSYGPRCLTSCPENVLEDGDNCINQCPNGKVESKDENKCVGCEGPCPKTCDGLLDGDMLYKDHFEDGKLDNCTIIRNNIFIGTSSFDGDAFLGYEGITLDLLERLSTIHEIQGYLTVQGHHEHFTDLNCFRNLKKIYGRQLYGDMFDPFVPIQPTPSLSSIGAPKQYSLFINSGTLQSLGMTSLQRVASGNILLYQSENLCYVAPKMWNKITKPRTDQTVELYQNMDEEMCTELGRVCDDQCAPIGCWGPGPQQCAQCRNAQIDDTCVQDCDRLTQYVQSNRTYNKPTICAYCDEQCQGSCKGEGPQNCSSCENVKDGPFCRSECPIMKYPDENKICQPCNSNCKLDEGCSGPDNTVGVGGCNVCHQVLVEDDTVLECMPDGAPCNNDSFFYHIALSSIHKLRGYSVCQLCDKNCLGCIGAGPSKCKECMKYKRGEHCVDHCGTNQFHDENNTCRDCHSQCRGCSGGSSPYDCDDCQNFEVLVNGNVTFCAMECPEEYPYTDRSIYCVANCSENQFVNEDDNRCELCHRECLGGCYDDRRSSCFQCKNVKYDTECLASCPNDFQNNSGVCMADPNAGSTNKPNGAIISTGVLVGICVAVIALMIFVVFGYVVYRKYVRSQYMLPGLALKDLKGADYGNGPLTPSGAAPNQAQLKIIKETELKRGSILGSGAFGTVYRGLWVPEGETKIKIPVAIKVLRDFSPSAAEELLEEAKVMASVDHPYLLRLACVCIAQEMTLITQLMPLGALLDYVREHKEKIGSHHLLNWSYQIAQGMVYLEEKHLIHRDLAARNVLVQTAQQVKITDFGLAKFLDVDENEFQAQGGKMPIKWLALECIQYRRFSHKSDVWSFGVTMWELMTFGSKPYDGVRARDVPDLLEKGERLPQPPICTIDVYMLMVKCWMLDEDSRPAFKQLSDELGRMAKDPTRYLVIQNDGDSLLAALPSPVPSDFYKSMINDEIDGAAASHFMDADEYLQPMSLNNVEHNNEFFPRGSGADFVAGGALPSPMSPTYPYSLNTPPNKQQTPTRKDSSMRYAPDPVFAKEQERQKSNGGPDATAIQMDSVDYLTPSIKSDYHDLTKERPVFEEPEYQNDPKKIPVPDERYLPLKDSTSGPPPSNGLGVDNLEYHALLGTAASPPVASPDPWTPQVPKEEPRYLNEEQMGQKQPLMADMEPRPLCSPSHSSSRPGSSLQSNGSSSVGVRLSGAASDNDLDHDYVNNDVLGYSGETSI
ncbi:epidermal growth factor receptor-like isoform X4 [Asterias amurensis]|uniref:epidermal growth factor receptor-like isoform X4 n=1 Tax=Asterias amurensis TaxID=7602 RepID=UPI003AB5D1E2